MASDWPQVLLEDIAEDVTVGHVGPMASEYVTTGIPFLRSQNVEPLRINESDLKFISPAFHNRLRKSALSPGDVVIVRTGKPGSCAVIPMTFPVSNCSDLVIVRCGARLDPRFLAYYVNSVAAHHVSSHLVGAVQQHFNVGSARKLLMAVPDLSEQREIVHILGALDDKIELNRRMNETLEAMTRALFKSWFVDFDPVRAKAEGRRTDLPKPLADFFPNCLEDSGLGKIPSGWTLGRLDNVLLLQRGFDLPSSRRTPGSYPVLAASGPSGTHDHYMVRGPGVTTGRSGVLGNVFYVHGDFWPLNTSLWVKEFRHSTPAYAYYLLQEVDFASYNAGSAVATLNRNHVSNLPMLLPPIGLIASFDRVASALLKRQKNNEDESITLASLRDTLLPKLLSGELRVRHAERLVESRS